MKHEPKNAFKCPKCGSTRIRWRRDRVSEYYDKSQNIHFEISCRNNCGSPIESYQFDAYTHYNNLSHLIEKTDKYPRSTAKDELLCGFMKGVNS